MEPMSDAELAMIKAHTLNGLHLKPQSVDLNDKIRLLNEIERLKAELARAKAE